MRNTYNQGLTASAQVIVVVACREAKIVKATKILRFLLSSVAV